MTLPVEYEGQISPGLENNRLTLAGYPRNETFHTLNKPKSTCINELTSLDDCVRNLNI